MLLFLRPYLSTHSVLKEVSIHNEEYNTVLLFSEFATLSLTLISSWPLRKRNRRIYGLQLSRRLNSIKSWSPSWSKHTGHRRLTKRRIFWQLDAHGNFTESNNYYKMSTIKYIKLVRTSIKGSVHCFMRSFKRLITHCLFNECYLIYILFKQGRLVSIKKILLVEAWQAHTGTDRLYKAKHKHIETESEVGHANIVLVIEEFHTRTWYSIRVGPGRM